jgi:penicillin V acylase-like amidase (Ntn superfamily)
MRNRRKSVNPSGFLITMVCCLLSIPLSEACTRVVYLGPDGNVITARPMDWKVDVGTNLWILPRGITRTGEAGPNSAHWTSKYGSVIATGYDISTTDGMNEKGLVANVLWLVESQYPQTKSTKPMLAISIWAQYVLDNFATVAEAIQRHPKCLRPLWDYNSRPAQYLFDTLANSLRPEEKDLLLRICSNAKHLLD